MVGGTCRPWHMQAQEGTLRRFIDTVSHILLFCLTPGGGRCQQVAVLEVKEPNTELPHVPFACHGCKDLDNQRLHSFLTPLAKALCHTCSSLTLPPQTELFTPGWQRQQEAFHPSKSLPCKMAQPLTQLCLAPNTTNK